jgi:hypothetical protein
MQHKVIDFAEKEFRRQIASDFATQATSNCDGLERKFTHAGRDVAAASLARDHKHLSVCRPLEHGIRIGE